MKKKIFSMILAIVLCFAMVVPVYAEGDAYANGIKIQYNGNEYQLSALSNASITATTTINDIKLAIDAENKENTIQLVAYGNQMLYFGGRYLSGSETLAECGIADGDTIYLYTKISGVNVRFEGKDYFVGLSEFSVPSLKEAIANSAEITAANGETIASDNQLLYDNTGNLLTSGSISGGANIYLYKKDGGTITSTETGYNDYKKPVTATYTTGAAADTVYSVNITWGSMEFNYKEPDKKWNPVTHEEEIEGTGSWTCAEGANKITVENHSNADVKVTFSFRGLTNVGQVTGEFADTETNSNTNVFSGNAIVLDTAVGKEAGKAATVVAELTLGGKPANLNSETAIVIGYVTITIEKP